MSQKKPLVIAVEDLHWIDKTSEEFLNYFIDWLANTPILLIFLYRPEYTHQWGSKSFYTKIGVDQLGLDSSGELLKAILEEGEVAPELKHLILNRSAGNPLFMEEFTHTLVENGSIEKRDNHFALIGNTKDIKVPDTIQGIIAARLDRLEDNLKRTMQVASVIGRDFAFKILQSITGVRAELKSHLLNLQGLEFIYEKNLFPELEYIFKHALTQEVAYNSLLQKRRKEIHEKIGNAIEELYPERLEEFYEMLAYHYCKSDNAEKAIRYCKLAGEKAVESYSHWNAINFFKDLFDSLNKQPDSMENKKEKIEALNSMISPFSMLGLPEESLWMYDKRIELAKELGDSVLVSTFYIGKANYYSHRGDNELAIKYSENAYEEARKNQNIELMVESSWALAVAYAPLGEYRKLTAIVPEVIQLIEKSERKSDFFSLGMTPYSLLSMFNGVGLGFLGNFEDGKKYLRAAKENADATNDLLILGTIEIVHGGFYITKGGWELALKHLKKGILYSQKVNYSLVEAYGSCMMGYGASMLGNHESGIKYVKKGLEMHLNCGVAMYLADSYYYAGSSFKVSGEFKLAKEYLEKSLNLSLENNEKVVTGRCKIQMGHLTWKIDSSDKQKALKYIKSGITILEKLKLKPHYAIGYLYLGELYLETKESEKAIKNLKIAEGMFQEMGMDFWLNKTQKLIAEL